MKKRESQPDFFSFAPQFIAGIAAANAMHTVSTVSLASETVETVPMLFFVINPAMN